MSKKQIFIGAGAVVLTVAGVFAGRASTKFVQAAHLYYTNGFGVCNLTIPTTPPVSFQTTGVNQATIRTSASGTRKLWTNSACSHAVYFIP